jgi:hypothetical protein
VDHARYREKEKERERERLPLLGVARRRRRWRWLREAMRSEQEEEGGRGEERVAGAITAAALALCSGSRSLTPLSAAVGCCRPADHNKSIFFPPRFILPTFNAHIFVG